MLVSDIIHPKMLIISNLIFSEPLLSTSSPTFKLKSKPKMSEIMIENKLSSMLLSDLVLYTIL